MVSAKREASLQRGIEQFLPLATLKEAVNLLHRLQEGEAFPRYVRRRIHLVSTLGLLYLATSIACTGATVVFLAGSHSLILLPALLLVPFVFLGSLFVQGYVFLSWLENRALLRTYGQRVRPAENRVARWLRKTLRADLGKLPEMPWGMTAVFLLAPVAMLAAVALKSALILIALHVLAPVLYARHDR